LTKKRIHIVKSPAVWNEYGQTMCLYMKGDLILRLNYVSSQFYFIFTKNSKKYCYNLQPISLI